MKKLIAMAVVAMALAGGGCASDEASDAKGTAINVAVDAGKELAVELCPLGVDYLAATASSASPAIAAIIKASAAASCAALGDMLIPAGATTNGAPDFCALPTVNAGEAVELADGSQHILTPEEAAAFNAGLDARCSP